jgi:FkbM family methyltransferase
MNQATATAPIVDEQTNGQAPPTEKLLIKFRHGLGDAVQLTILLQHLRQLRPHLQIDVAALVGKHSVYYGQCENVFILDRDPLDTSRYNRVLDLDWPECVTCYPDSPSSKVERCLREVFQITPRVELCRYVLRPRPQAFEKAHRYLTQFCKVAPLASGRYPVVLIHYEGNTSADRKNLPVEMVRGLCEVIIEAGAVPVILDWDRRSPLPDGQRVHNPHAELEIWGGTGTGDAEALAALIELSSLLVGVDSGPLHVAGATSTPTIGVWTQHHPLHYFALADNVTHLVPANHEDHLRGDREAGRRFFEQHYRHQAYVDLAAHLAAVVKERLQDSSGALIYTRNFWMRADNSQQDLVVVKDIAEDDSYRVRELPMPAPVVVDVGAHIGCFSRRVHEHNPLARIFAVECCPENIPALEKNVGGFATIIQAAMTYERDVALLNAVYPNCVTTGGSTLKPRRTVEEELAAQRVGEAPGDRRGQYWADFRPIETLTIEELLDKYRLERIDVLKLDCEGSEFSILRATTSLDRIGMIVGEYHGREEFCKLVSERFADWDLRILKHGELGSFWLTNPSNGERSTSVVRSLGEPSASRPVVLSVDGKEVPADADYSLRFVEYADRPATPVLYFRGLRVIKPWTIQMRHDEPADPFGISGGKE